MPTRTPDALVREFIEKMSGEMLEERYRSQLAELIRGHAGLYALYAGERLYYVGLATDLMRRMKQHQNDRHAGAWDSFSVYLTARDEHIKPLESLLLRVFQPPGNGQRGKLPGAVDRRRALLAAMRRQDAEQREAMFEKRRSAGPVGAAGPARRPAAKATGARLPKAMRLRAEYKGRTVHAVINKDGSVRRDGKRYGSLSAAASAVTGSPTNGWFFWRYCDERGEWRRMTDLR